MKSQGARGDERNACLSASQWIKPRRALKLSSIMNAWLLTSAPYSQFFSDARFLSDMSAKAYPFPASVLSVTKLTCLETSGRYGIVIDAVSKYPSEVVSMAFSTA